MSPDDATLLRRYAGERSEAAFTALVQRHLGLVYSAALRQLAGDAHLARDATQLVFIDLARKARTLSSHPVLAAWLYTATHHTTAKLARTEQRRRAHEQKAAAMPGFSTETSADWERLQPLIDSALIELPETDRRAILLRFFEHRSFTEIAAQLRFGEDAARKRVDRALDKLHAALSRRGIASSSAALATALTSHGIQTAPAGLAQIVSVFAVKTALSGGLIGTVSSILSLTKFQIGAAAAVVIVSVGGLALQQNERSHLQQDIARVKTEASRLASTVTPLRARLTQTSFRQQIVTVNLRPSEKDIERAVQTRLLPYVPKNWAPLIRRFHLSPETVTALFTLYGERNKLASYAKAWAQRSDEFSKDLIEAHAEIFRQTATVELEPRFRALLGDAGFNYFTFVERTEVARNDLEGFTQTAANAGVPLDDGQMDQLAEILTGIRAAVPKLVSDRTRSGATVPSPLPVDFLDRAALILAPAQQDKLSQLQAARLALNEIDRRNRIAARQGLLRLNAASSIDYLARPDSPSSASPRD